MDKETQQLLATFIERWIQITIGNFLKNVPLEKEEIKTINKLINYFNDELAKLQQEVE